MSKVRHIYWDSCVWLALINGERDRVAPIERLYEGGRRGLVEIWTSTISIVEVRRLGSEKDDPKPLSNSNLAQLQGLFRQPFVKPIPVAQDIAEDARELIRTTPGLKKFQDSIHLASALRWCISEMHTFDHVDLLHLNSKLICRDGTKLQICQPSDVDVGPLFGGMNQ